MPHLPEQGRWANGLTIVASAPMARRGQIRAAAGARHGHVARRRMRLAQLANAPNPLSYGITRSVMTMSGRQEATRGRTSLPSTTSRMS